MMEAVFWISLALVFHTFVGYPLLVHFRALRSVRKQSSAPPAAVAEFTMPSCSVLIVAFNEEAVLIDKIQTVLKAAGSDCIREIVIVSDGSTDGTEQSVMRVGDARVRCVAHTDRRGKPARLNAQVPGLQGDVVVLTDARQHWDYHALQLLLAEFRDPRTVVVSGELVFRLGTSGGATGEGMNAYWRYEKWIRANESCRGCVPGATGAFYALRRAAFHSIPENTILDDVAIPMLATSSGGRCCFASGAVIWDEPSTNARRERIRKRRTLAGNLQLMARHPRWMLPGGHPHWFAFLSHKACRLFAPVALLAMAGISLLLVNTPLFLMFAVVQGAFYGFALLAALSSRLGTPWRGVLAAPLMFVLLNVYALLAWSDALRGRFSATWERADGAPPRQRKG